MGVCTIDHLVVTAPSLEAGAGYVAQTLGVALQPGGAHARMGTHNLLLRLGDTAYLEVIAVNPAAAHPGRPRWFGLDEPEAGAAPRLATWVARADDVVASLAEAREDLGSIEAMNRGDLEWLITVPPGGRPLLDGVAPALIQWPAGHHPAARLPDAGCRLLRLEAFHPEAARVSALLDRLGLRDTVPVGPLPRGTRGQLIAHIDTPAGARAVCAPGLSVGAGHARPRGAQ